MGMGLGTLGSRFGRLGNAPSKGVGVPAWAFGTDLWKDFTVPRGTLADPTDTHASTIYAPNAAGVYAPFAANVLTRTDLGLQTVPTRTNVALQSQTFDNASWVKTRTTVTADATISPDGALTSDALIEDTATGTHTLFQSAGSATGTYTFSVFAKANGRRYAVIGIGDASVAADNALFDLQTGTVVSTGASVSSSITAVSNGFYRCAVTKTVAATSINPGVAFRTDTAATTSQSYTGDGVSGAYLWQAQLEVGAFASPPIVTTGSSATVNGNQQVIDLTGRLATGVAGIVQFNWLVDNNSSTPIPLDFYDGTQANRVMLYITTGPSLRLTSSGGGDISLGTIAPGLVTVAFAASSGFMNGRVVGNSLGSSASITYPTVDRVSLGGLGSSVAQNNYSFSRKLALSFGPQDATTLNATYARAQIAAVS